MSTMALSSLPAAVGGAALSGLWRGTVWTLIRIFRAPVASGLLIAMTLGFAYAAANALYMQPERHPAPLFSEDAMTTSSVGRRPEAQPEPQANRPAVRPQAAPRPAPVSSAPSIVTAPIAVPSDRAYVAEGVSDEDIRALQENLQALHFYAGEPDGVYGPQTAAAIRAFELGNGMDPIGAATPEIVKAVKAAGEAAAPHARMTRTPTPRVDIGAGDQQARIVPASMSPPEPIPAPQGTSADTGDHLMDIVNRVARAARGSVGPATPSAHTELVMKIQRGLASLGFLRGKIDGIAGADTAEAIRKFEVYYSYKVTGEATPELLDLLVDNGAKV